MVKNRLKLFQNLEIASNSGQIASIWSNPITKINQLGNTLIAGLFDYYDILPKPPKSPNFDWKFALLT